MEFCDIHASDVVFLGAGFSRAATDGLSPLMADFFAQLDKRKYWLLWHFLEECFSDPFNANVEEAILKLDQLSAAPLSGKDAFIDQCRERQSQLRMELDQYILERLGGLQIADDNWAARWLLSVSDRVLSAAMRRSAFLRGAGQGGHAAAEAAVRRAEAQQQARQPARRCLRTGR